MTAGTDAQAPGLEDVEQAAERIADAIVRTPCNISRTLSQLIGAEIVVKFENLQFTGSFKERGALNKLLSLDDREKRTGVIAMSAGNHAQGVAYHARRLGIPATIVMPRFTPNVKVGHTRDLGAKVILVGDSLSEADSHARQLAERDGPIFLHPYDDPLVIAGQGTVALEMLQDHPDLDTLIVPVGGGGLISGCALAAKALKPGLEVVGVQTELYPAMLQAVHGQPIVCGGHTIAEGIAVKRPGERTQAIVRALVDELLPVPEDAIERAIVLFLEIEKTVAEGAGAAGLAALLARPERFRERKIGLVLSGGNIDARLLASVIMRGMVRDGRVIRLRLDITDVPGQLARVTQLVAEHEGNVIDVAHHRMLLGLPAKSADLDLLLETRGRDHGREIVSALRNAGFAVRKEDVA